MELPLQVHEAHRVARVRRPGLGHQLFEGAVAGLQTDDGRDEATDHIPSLIETAFGAGATRAGAIPVSEVVVDPRVTMKCMIPPCEVYGTDHMCPPFSPTAAEFTGYLDAYRHGVLVQVQDKLPEDFEAFVAETEDNWYCSLHRQKAWAREYGDVMMPLWRRLHLVVLAVEKEAKAQGHAGAVAIAGSDCGFCQPDDEAGRTAVFRLARPDEELPTGPFEGCIVAEACPYPDLARPAMEAVGIDVVRTLRNAGWELRFPATSYLEEGVAQWTGLVLVA